MDVVVFGATGFVGRNLVHGLVSAGHDVVAVSRSGGAVEGAKICVSMDRLEDIPDLTQGAVCFHVAAHRYDATRFEMAQSDILTANVELTNKVYAFCAQRQIKEVRLASSVAVYEAGLATMDDTRAVDFNASPHRNEAFYAWSKRWAEIVSSLFLQRYGISTVSFRLSNPYGPFDSTDIRAAHVLPAFVMRALDNEPSFALRGDPHVERDFIWVGDVVDVLIESISWTARSEAFNLCTGTSVTLMSLAEIILGIANRPKPLVLDSEFVPAAVRARPSSADRVRAAFGIGAFTSLEIGLAQTIDWYRSALAHA